MPPPGLSRPLLQPLPIFQVSPASGCKRLLPTQRHSHPQLQQQVRHESSRRRLIKKLRLPPSPSFASPSSTSQDHIIFNPPSSAPNVYHTPLTFLPANDPRRKLYTQLRQKPSNTERPSGSSVSSKPPSSSEENVEVAPSLPPALKQPQAKKYHLTAADVAEMQRLRAQDPYKWTRAALAKKFECSEFFVGVACKNPEAGEAKAKELEEIKRKWGPRKRRAREDRVKRREMWGRDA